MPDELAREGGDVKEPEGEEEAEYVEGAVLDPPRHVIAVSR